MAAGMMMNLSNFSKTSRSRRKGSAHGMLRQFLLSASVVTLLGACSLGSDEEERGSVGFVEGFIGGVAVDEPRAALVGREILSAGGTATDAAVAMYFTLAVTLPSSASLGGGGVCIVHDSKSGDTKALNFLARTPQSIPAGATRPSAVPGNPRGFFALHARYGVLRWEQLLAPAANLARFGTPVSRALARDLNAARDGLKADRAFSHVFAGPTPGSLVGEGDFLTQVDLSVLIGRMVVHGPGDFYAGQSAQQLIAAVARAGGSLSAADLRTYRPVWSDTLQVSVGEHMAHFSPPPAAAGAVAASMWQMLAEDDRFINASANLRNHMLAETGMRAYADRARWMLVQGETRWSNADIINNERLIRDMASYSATRHTAAADLTQKPVSVPENPAGASFVVADRDGGAVACGLSMNNLFGTGRIAPGTGIVLATVPGQGGRGPLSLGPMMITNPYTNKLFWAGAASGGVAAPTSLMNVAARAILAERPLREAMGTKRVHHSGAPDETYYEADMDPAEIQELVSRGHTLKAAPVIGRVNAFYCFNGLPENPESCDAMTDPRGFGLSLVSGE